MASTTTPHNTATALKARIEQLHAEIARLEALRAVRQTEFQTTLERDRTEHSDINASNFFAIKFYTQHHWAAELAE